MKNTKFYLTCSYSKNAQVKMHFNPLSMKFDHEHVNLPTIPHKKINDNPEFINILFNDKNVDNNIIKIDNILKLLKTYTNLIHLKNVEYFCNDPFLYMDEIKYFHTKINEICFNKVKGHISTNGYFINKESVNYLSENNFKITLQHDGPNQKLIKGNKGLHFNLILDLYNNKKSTNNFSIYSILNEKCFRVSKLIHFFIKKFDQDIQISKIVPSVFLSNDKLINYHNYLYQDIIKGKTFNNVIEHNFLFETFKIQVSNPVYIYNPTQFKCHKPQINTLSLDLNGNIYKCNAFYKINNQQLNHISSLNNINNICGNTPLDKWHRCGKCVVVTLCRSICPYVKDENCDTKYYTYFAYFRAFLKLAFDYNLINVEIIKDY